MHREPQSRRYSLEDILDLVERYWGFRRLRPLQEEAIRAGLEGSDSLVVLPTGGGKSLCYQLPPLLSERTDLVISPLISLMKDQVDALRSCGYPAGALHSGLSAEEKRRTRAALLRGEKRLLFVSPERVVLPEFMDLIGSTPIRAIAIDEAHCISHWGHDFRPEYRQLALLRERFPSASIHAFTATATPQVREDIVEQLRLRDPSVLVGRFDRPNLIYRVIPRHHLRPQLLEVLSCHRGQAAIVYCISRRETERLASFLRQEGHRATCYHAGLESPERRRRHEAFSGEEIDIVVATVAFGMGIDRSDVRAIIHTAMPRSLEHYQQETGRAGRDGLEAECVLFYSPADILKWKSILESTEAGVELDPEEEQAKQVLLEQMRAYCAPGRCRHKLLSEHFGQAYASNRCEACDVCLGESEGLEDGTVTAQKILSCVARLKQRFGVTQVVDVLTGAETAQIRLAGLDGVSTYGLLQNEDKSVVRNYVFQLIDQGLLVRTAGQYPVLNLNEKSVEVLRGERKVLLVPPRTRRLKKTKYESDSWQGVDRPLFERLRTLRLHLARQREVPPYIIFSDASLRDMARLKPLSPASFRVVHGVGERKLADFGERFISEIQQYLKQQGAESS